MEKFMSVGELAKIMETTVRTLQYYDKEGLLKPSAMSEGGRRLYSSKDMIRLHQILSFKYLGFSLDEIKNKLFSLDNPKEVAIALEHQQKAVEQQITVLEEALQAIKALHQEVTQMHEVDFSNYADIIKFLKVGNDNYWVWKCFDNPLKEHIRTRFGNNSESGLKILGTYKEILDEALMLKNEGVEPGSERCLKLAEKWWNMVTEFTGGDLSLLPQLEAFNQNKDGWDRELAEKQKEIDPYIGAALKYYLAGLGGL